MWEWHDPKENDGSNGLKLLDGDVKHGECGVFVDAIITLAVLPSPLGLGLPEQNFKKKIYDGQFHDGFVVDELKMRTDNFVVDVRCNFNKVINVYKPAAQETQYTFWGNHKIVECDGILWDPCYGAKYNRPSDVVVFDIFGKGVCYPYWRGIDKFKNEAYFLDAGVFNTRQKYSGPWKREDTEMLDFIEEQRKLIHNNANPKIIVQDHL